MARADWKIEKEIGRGGQGKTLLVSNLSTEQQGVLKEIHSGNDPKRRSRLLTEVTNLRIVKSRGGKVPEVLDENTHEFESKNKLFFVMSHIEGSRLDEYVKKNGVLSLENATKIIECLAQTLSLAHESEITHRDIKPQNIIIENDDLNNVFLLDFGLSFTENETEKTELGEQIGNRFMALPEGQVYGTNRDPRSDVTQLVGIFLYLINGGNEPRVLLDEHGLPPHRRQTTMPKLSENDQRKTAVNALLNRGFSQRLNERFQSIDEFVNRLRQIDKISATEEIPDIEILAREASKTILDANIEIQKTLTKQRVMKKIIKIIEIVEIQYRKTKVLSDFHINGEKNPLGIVKLPNGLNGQFFGIRVSHTHSGKSYEVIYNFILSESIEASIVRQIQFSDMESGVWSEPILWLTDESTSADIAKLWLDDINREIAKGIDLIVRKLTNQNN